MFPTEIDWVAVAAVTCSFGGVAWVASAWRRVRVAEAALKRDLADRGFTPEEIVRVVEASPRRLAGCTRG